MPESGRPATASPDLWAKSQEHLLHETLLNPLPTTVPPPVAGMAGAIGQRHVIAFIGLPARGKPFMAERLNHYLSFFHGATCRSFDIARAEFKEDEILVSELKHFLEAEDPRAGTQVKAALDADEDETCRHLKNVDSGRVAILYSHNEFETHSRLWSGSSKSRRWKMQRALATLSVHCHLCFIEVIVSDPELVRRFIVERYCGEVDSRLKEDGKVDNNEELEAKVDNVLAKINEHHREYVTIQDDGSEDELAYIKLMNYGQRVVTNRIQGFLIMRIVQFVTHLRPKQHKIYLSRHGQSTYNLLQKIGGNAGLTPAGEAYATWLGKWVPENMCGSADPEKQRCCRLWTSSMKRTIETARHIPHPVIKKGDGQVWQQMYMRVYRNLDEIFAGEYEGMTYEEIEQVHGDEAILRKKDKLGYRYPRGESYYDLIARLDILMHELESYSDPLLIVSHQATLRMIYAYLMGIDRAKAPKLDIPLHTVIEIQYDGFGRCGETALEKRFKCPIAIDVLNSSKGTDGQKDL